LGDVTMTTHITKSDFNCIE